MMGIIGKILLFGGFFVAVISQIFITELAYKIRYQAGLSCVMISPCHALVSDLRKDKKVSVFIKLWGVSLLMVIFGSYVLAVA